MSGSDFNRLLDENGLGSWQGMLMGVGLRVVAAVAPKLLELLEKLLIAGAGTAVARLEKIAAPAETPDYVLSIVRGIEKDHGPSALPSEQWAGPDRAEFVRDSLRIYLKNAGAGEADDATLNQLIENAVGKLKVEQTAALKAATAIGGRSA